MDWADHAAPHPAPAAAVACDLLPCPLPFPGAEDELRRATGCCRSVRSRRGRRLANRCWANEAARSLNEMNGHGDRIQDVSSSIAQRMCLERVRGIFESVGAPPPLTPTEAFVELCGHRPGYDDTQPAARCNFKREQISLPAADGFVCNAGDLLEAKDLDAWVRWREVLLREPAEACAEQARLGLEEPYTARELKGKVRECAGLVHDLVSRGLATLHEARDATIGVFSVAKKEAGKQRLILDTRIANTRVFFRGSQSWAPRVLGLDWSCPRGRDYIWARSTSTTPFTGSRRRRGCGRSSYFPA